MFHWVGKHVHTYELKHTENEVWAECSCGHQADIPQERLEEAYSKLRSGDLTWNA